jgi:hypothetical protein
VRLRCSANEPADFGDLVKITIDVNTSSSVLCGSDYFEIAIRANGIRGGVVMEDASTIEPNAPGCAADLPTHSQCMAEAHPDYEEWVSVGEPDCWCYPRQCRGDVDCTKQFGLFWVYTGDLNIFKNCFAEALLPEGCICVDFAHDIQFSLFRVYTSDLNIFKTYFANTVVPCCDADQDCDPTNDSWFNCWMCPP